LRRTHIAYVALRCVQASSLCPSLQGSADTGTTVNRKQASRQATCSCSCSCRVCAAGEQACRQPSVAGRQASSISVRRPGHAPAPTPAFHPHIQPLLDTYLTYTIPTQTDVLYSFDMVFHRSAAVLTSKLAATLLASLHVSIIVSNVSSPGLTPPSPTNPCAFLRQTPCT
jgi:hypothetical protein